MIIESRGLLEDGLADARAVGSARMEAGNAVPALELRRVRQGRTDPQQSEASPHAGTSGDRWLLGLATGNHGVLMAEFGEIEKAIGLTDEAYRLCRGVGDVSLTALWLSNLAGYMQRGNTAEARRRLDESLELARLIDDTRGIGQALDNLGWIELLEGDLEDAFSCFEEAEAIARRLGARWLGADAIWGFAHVAAAAGDADRAARLAGPRSRSVDRPAVATPFTPHLDAARAALASRRGRKPGTRRGARRRAPARSDR